ncbi:sporozoite surface protein 2-like [Halichondria panicea]|uniref:sporozoite surface protein 2-like n=1 Tax=Halichondria panicea TaxID=6063 RepID=UPI00312B55C9
MYEAYMSWELQLGIKVLVERKGGKLENKYSGPYIIKTSDGKGVYTLKDLDGKVLKKKCNIKRLKVYMDPSSLVEQKALSGQTPPDKSNGSTQPEKSNGPTPPEDPNGPTPPEKSDGPTPPEYQNGPTTLDDPNVPTSPDRLNDQLEDPNGPTLLDNTPGLSSEYVSSGFDDPILMECLFDPSLLRLYIQNRSFYTSVQK